MRDKDVGLGKSQGPNLSRFREVTDARLNPQPSPRSSTSLSPVGDPLKGAPSLHRVCRKADGSSDESVQPDVRARNAGVAVLREPGLGCQPGGVSARLFSRVEVCLAVRPDEPFQVHITLIFLPALTVAVLTWADRRGTLGGVAETA